MKNFAFALLVASLMAAAPGWAEKPAPNAAEYTVAIQVQSSRLTTICGSGLCNQFQSLSVTIEGKRYELTSKRMVMDVLRVGDFKAKMIKEETTKPYQYQRTYEFLFSDGTVRDYSVTGESE
ncbi:MAG: hypothetical protein WBQ94_25620 [Terracidiphilus sp.]